MVCVIQEKAVIISAIVAKKISHNLCSAIQSHAFDVCKYGSSDSEKLSLNPSHGSEQTKIATNTYFGFCLMWL